MRKLTKLQLACAAVLAIFCANYASAFNPSSYAATSKLASGKWMKISIHESGMYEITYDELREMGFSNPQQVKVYGSGGARIDEVLNGTAADDLTRVPMLRYGDKICFYGIGPVNLSLTGYSTNSRFSRVFNPYSQVGCYFLTENNLADYTPTKRPAMTVASYIDTPTSLDYFYHERELISIGSSGKEYLGEDFLNEQLMVDYYLPELADSTILVETVIAASASTVTYANAVLHSDGAQDTTNYTVASSRIYVPANSYVYYNYASPYAQLKLTHPAEHGQYEPILKSATTDYTKTLARLDYFTITYKHNNVIREAGNNQLLMGYTNTRGNERFMLPNASRNTVVWSILSPRVPQEITTSRYNDESGQGLSFFANSTNVSLYIAFDPTKTLKKIDTYEPVANQNLHAMAVPDMLIITDKSLMEQAQRLADMHIAVDGIDVAVVDQEEVFNEFSSGTRDAMAYRLLCKMLYDRDPNKFKNLLLFGTGTHDNRELQGKHPGTLLSYQSDNSNNEDYSFTADDFFGFLVDNSGTGLASDKLCIGVGRITCADAQEAKTDVDKIVEYYTNPDYGVWRNNAIVTSDAPDGGLYMFQGEGCKQLIDNELGTGMHVNTVHNSMYARSNNEPNINFSRRTATDGRQMWSNSFKEGAYFATYVGHAGPLYFTKFNHMWTSADVARTVYPHWPIMSTACCDVAHFDSDTRGIAESMFHKRDGGAIALLTSSRMVYASSNDMLNRYFITALFNTDSVTDARPTLGEAYKQSKLGFTTPNTNKLSFFLLGDPAMKINYPYSRFNITKVNGVSMANPQAVASVSPLMRFEVEAQVVDKNGNLDGGFNGNATVTLYDKEDEFTSLTFTANGETITRSIPFNREKLAEITGRVVNGVFRGSVIVPQSVLGKNEYGLLRVYAHKDNSDYMVNGFTKNIKLVAYNESAAITDNQAPVITDMYINDQTSFAEGSVVGGNSMLYITATDDQGINVQSGSIDKQMTLALDGGKVSYSDIIYYATMGEEGKSVSIEFPLNSLAEGLHTLTYTVYDMLGNSATRTISFMVGQGNEATLVADKQPAFVNGEVNFDLDTDMSRIPEVIVRVTDATGKLVWMTTTDSFPVAWDMRDMNGNKVPAGLYRYFGTYHDGSNSGGTPISKLIVLDALKTAAQ